MTDRQREIIRKAIFDLQPVVDPSKLSKRRAKKSPHEPVCRLYTQLKIDEDKGTGIIHWQWFLED